MPRLTEHFTFEELVYSDTAERLNINNDPDNDPVLLSNLHLLANRLEDIRTLVDKPLIITSGYRSFQLNMAIGGSSKSQHMLALAADIKVRNMDPYDLCTLLQDYLDVLEIDQLIYEGSWTHVGFSTDYQPRKQVLTAVFDKYGVAYLNGLQHKKSGYSRGAL
jgi:zinc D-Ala-D-Ala carboxypeptidase